MEVVKELDVFSEEMERMFSYKHKLLSRVPEDYLKRYKTLYYFLLEKQQEGELPVHPNYWGDNELVKNIYEKKYFLKNLDGKCIERKPEDLFIRVAAFIAAVEEDLEIAKKTAIQYYKDMYYGLWIPGGRVITGAGDLYRIKTLANCFVSLIEEDSIEGIYKAAYEAARTYSYGGGIGIDISPLRPAGSVVHNAANNSTGAVSFMELYSLTTGLIGQSGRRGALMLTIDVKHPDVKRFIKIKKTPNWITSQITNYLKWSNMFNEKQLRKIQEVVMENTQVRFANISIKATDEFMYAVEEQNRYGRALLVYRKMVKGKKMEEKQTKDNNYSYGMPRKDIKKYEFIGSFSNMVELNSFLSKTFSLTIEEKELDDPYKRDVYGDYVIELEGKDYDLAIRRAGDFLLYFSSEETGTIKELVPAREIWNMFLEGNYKTAEPGIMFWDRIVEYSPSNYVGRPICSTNPCGEVPLEDGGACNLGSLNLSAYVKNPFKTNAEIDWKKLGKAIEHLVRFLDNVVEWNIYLNPLEKQRIAAKETRRVGLGVMGIADMFLKLGLAYDEDRALEVFEEVMKFIANKAYETSAKLAKEKGPSPIYNYENYSKGKFFREVLEENVKKLIKRNGIRNIALLSIAPTGTISQIPLTYSLNGKNYLGVSSGIEPIFALYYTRRSESFGNKRFLVFHSTVQAYLDENGLSDIDEARLKEFLPPHFFKTAHHIDPKKRVQIQGIAQKYVDHSISSTINLPEDIHPEVISEIYLEAWRNGLKGVTVYRDGSRYPILSVEGKKTEFQEFKDKKFRVIVDGKEYVVNGDEIIVLPNGRLTTVYHGIKEGIFSM